MVTGMLFQPQSALVVDIYVCGMRTVTGASTVVPGTWYTLGYFLLT